MKTLFTITVLLLANGIFAQIPVEIFTGHEKTSFDMMFFKYARKRSGENSRFLFFNRNRAVMDYRMTSKEYLPSFGITGAISYNAPKLKGAAPVMVAQVFNRAVLAKAGIQYAYAKKKLTVFSWIVSELRGDPSLDLFILGRFTPRISPKLDLFLQAETVNVFATVSEKNYSFIQRIRLGLKLGYWQFGTGIDFSETGRNDFITTTNAGIFLRHEF